MEITSGIGWHDRARLDWRAPEWATTLNPTERARFLGFLKGGNRAESLCSESGAYTRERIYVRVGMGLREWQGVSGWRKQEKGSFSWFSRTG
jgi:predicted component of type VI protein secretion system